MLLVQLPRASLCHRPTPLEPLPNLTRWLGGPKLYVKRDDCTGLASGGNKTRKLEFLMGDAMRQGADTIVTQGAIQSNHVRQTAAAAAKLGLKCQVLLERRVQNAGADYETTGNVLLDRLCGASVELRPLGADMNVEIDGLAERLRDGGAKPYVIPGGGSNPIGALGYVEAASEIIRQAKDSDLRIDYLVHATGSAGTQAGLLTGFAGTNSDINVLGISVRHPKATQEEIVYKLAVETAKSVKICDSIPRDRVMVYDDFVGPGYGQLTDAAVEAVELMAQREGILLDPVYSGKGMAGLIGLIHKGFFSKEDNVVFLHTGGSAALFAYPSLGRNRIA